MLVQVFFSIPNVWMLIWPWLALALALARPILMLIWPRLTLALAQARPILMLILMVVHIALSLMGVARKEGAQVHAFENRR